MKPPGLHSHKLVPILIDLHVDNAVTELTDIFVVLSGCKANVKIITYYLSVFVKLTPLQRII